MSPSTTAPLAFDELLATLRGMSDDELAARHPDFDLVQTVLVPVIKVQPLGPAAPVNDSCDA